MKRADRVTLARTAGWIVVGAALALGVQALGVSAARGQGAPDDDRASAQAIEQKLASVALTLARHDLKYMQSLSRKVGDVFGAPAFEKQRIRIAVLEQYEEIARTGDLSATHQADVRRAEGEVGLAELRLKEARIQVGQGLLDRLALRKRELELEFARAWLAKVKHPSFRESLETQNYWRTIRLERDVMNLRTEILGRF